MPCQFITKRRALFLAALVALYALAFLTGCVGPITGADGKGVSTINGVHNVARQDGQAWESAYQSVYPTNTVIDDAGANVQTGGPNTVLGVVLGESPKLFTSNPADTAFERLTYTAADGSVIEIEGFSSTKSTVISAWNEQVIAWAQSQNLITTEQASVARELVARGMDAMQAIVTVLGGL